MGKRKYLGPLVAGFCAGTVTGLFGGGGGMVLVPLLTLLTPWQDDVIFPSSLAVILPICLVSLGIQAFRSGLDLKLAFPYLLGSVAGGLLAGKWGEKIPVNWLHRGLGLLILWGGVQYLC